MDLVLILQVLSISAIITTVSLFFCGIPICFEIWKRKSTKDISGLPILMGLLGGSFWLRYGFLKSDPTMITVNAVGVILYSIYSVFYLAMSNPRRMFAVQLILVLSTIFTMVFLVLIYGVLAIDLLGICCMTFNIANFGAPLAGLKVVLRKRSCDTLPLPMCIANLLVSSQWFLYGTIVDDIYVMIPNGCGMVLATLQLSLFIVFPMKVGQVAPIGRCFPICANKPSMDEEKAKYPSAHRAYLVGDIIRKISHVRECHKPLVVKRLTHPTCSFTTKAKKERRSAMWEKYARSLSFDTASTHTTGSQLDISIDHFNLMRTLSAPQLTEDQKKPVELDY